jgi:hypothetical protein
MNRPKEGDGASHAHMDAEDVTPVDTGNSALDHTLDAARPPCRGRQCDCAAHHADAHCTRHGDSGGNSSRQPGPRGKPCAHRSAPPSQKSGNGGHPQTLIATPCSIPTSTLRSGALRRRRSQRCGWRRPPRKGGLGVRTRRWHPSAPTCPRSARRAPTSRTSGAEPRIWRSSVHAPWPLCLQCRRPPGAACRP